MPLVVAVAVFVDFFNWHDHEKILQYNHDKMFMACRGGRREVGRLCTLNVVSCRYVGIRDVITRG